MNRFYNASKSPLKLVIAFSQFVWNIYGFDANSHWIEEKPNESHEKTGICGRVLLNTFADLLLNPLGMIGNGIQYMEKVNNAFNIMKTLHILTKTTLRLRLVQ